jgi:hypothetical protein
MVGARRKGGLEEISKSTRPFPWNHSQAGAGEWWKGEKGEGIRTARADRAEMAGV